MKEIPPYFIEWLDTIEQIGLEEDMDISDKLAEKLDYIYWKRLSKLERNLIELMYNQEIKYQEAFKESPWHT